jgi:alpha-L-arabinofuranosidase
MNRSTDEPAVIELQPTGMSLRSVQSAEYVSGPNADAGNTFDEPGVIKCQHFDGVALDEGMAILKIPALSVVAISFSIEP